MRRVPMDRASFTSSSTCLSLYTVSPTASSTCWKHKGDVMTGVASVDPARPAQHAPHSPLHERAKLIPWR